MVYLETNRLILRDYTESDADAYFELRSDPKTMYYLQAVSYTHLTLPTKA